MTKQPFASLRISLDDDVEEQFNKIFDADFFDNFFRHFDTDISEETQIALRDGLYKAVNAYIGGVLDQSAYRTGKEENKALERVSVKAKQLYDAIMELHQYGQTEKKLAEAIRKSETLHRNQEGIELTSLCKSRSNTGPQKRSEYLTVAE